MKRLCTICVRGGSKGVRNKNGRLLLGKPLVSYSVDHALRSGQFDHVGVSSDSMELLEVARGAGATTLVKRPSDLATDAAPKIPVIRHCARSVEEQRNVRFDTIVDLDATSPLRSDEDILACIALLETDPSATNVITATPSRRSPYFNMVERSPDGAISLAKQGAGVTRRQDAPPCFDMNASIYVWRPDVLFSCDTLFLPGTRLHIMPEERSWDIDSELDLEFVEFLLRKRRKAL